MKLMKRVSIFSIFLFWLVQFSNAATYYVDINGNDASGDGSTARPWRTLKFAVTKVQANQGHTIKLSAGTFIEQGPINVDTGINIEGAGHSTIIKSSSSFFFNPERPGYSPEKFLIRFVSSSPTNGRQSIKNLTINGDGKKLHGGILFQNRDNILVEGIRFEYINFTGMWLWKSKNSRVTDCEFLNCAWASYEWCAGAFIVGDLDNVEIDKVKINEGNGYGLKALIFGNERGRISNTKIHDCSFKVNPYGVWRDGQGPNIALELWGTYMSNIEIYNNYFDNNLSLVCEFPDYTGKTVRVHHNLFDVGTRSENKAYSLELCIDYAEIDNNFFNSGSNAIVNWHDFASQKDWDIHHNVFYGLQQNPSHAIRTTAPVSNVKFNNNTIEFTGSTVDCIIGLRTGTNRNIEIKNNLIINSNSGSTANKLVSVASGATLQGLQVANNLLYRLDAGNVAGSYSNNITGVEPQINASGNRPNPYYLPKTGSPLIDKGLNLGYPFSGSAPDIGAYELGSTTTPPANVPPTIGLTSPTNNSSFNSGSTITLGANAADANGTVAKIEFFSGSTKLGEDVTSPYSFAWNNATAGTHTITARATDNQGASTTSTSISVTVLGSNVVPSVNVTSPSNNASFISGSSVTINASAVDTDGTITKVEFFNGTTKLGEDTSSPYSYNWANAPAGTHSITARATDNRNAIANSAVITITIVANSRPAVALTSPANNASLTAGTAVSINATASDADGSVSKVEFYNGNTKLGEDASAPYSFSWSNVPAGTHIITARATDNLGATQTSAAITITVTANPNSGPLVSITNPSNNSTHIAGTNLTINATASDTNGNISKVEFYIGTTKLGEDTTSPYSIVWSNLPEGNFTITAKAIDNLGASASAQVNVVVEVQANAPIVNAGDDVTLELPEDSQLLTANANDSDGNIVNYEWTQSEGPNSATITHNSDGGAMVSNLEEGTYKFILTVTDNHGLTSSDEIIIQVTQPALQNVQLPLVFTPNNDGIDDTWNWSDTESFQDCRLTIYNRLGQKIYETVSYDNTWDGQMNGSPLQEDAYYYVITCDNGDLNGAVRIVR